MAAIPLEMTLSGPDPVAILRACQQRGLAPTGAPREVEADDRRVDKKGDWLSRALAQAKEVVYASFPGAPHKITLYLGELAYVGLPAVEVEPGAFARALSGIPFELAAFGTVHMDWLDGSLGERYSAPSFGDRHAPLGWGCAFRGAGHDRLVSRRWLDFGPWRKVEAPEDTTLVQFHDLAADSRTALEQARPGHERMGITDRGGFIQSGFAFSRELEGLYDAGERKMKVVVHGRAVSELEMLEWCAARKYQSFGPSKPLRNVAFVFMEEAKARQHLHELWLRELECWTIRGGEEVRLDAEYAPAPAPPAWVSALG
jgi:hypothetical protein